MSRIVKKGTKSAALAGWLWSPYNSAAHMRLLAFLLAAQAARPDTVPPYLAFPEAVLDDPAAYEGYETRVYRDARRNAFQVYLNRRTGRWADAVNESVGFTARDWSAAPAAIQGGYGSTRNPAPAKWRSSASASVIPRSVMTAKLTPSVSEKS